MGFYTESARQIINPIDVPTFMAECAKAERKLFEGLIELDFAQVYKENGLAVFTEEETAAADAAGKEASGNTIQVIIKKAQEALKKAFDTVIGKLKELTDKAAEILSKKILENPKAKECTAEVIWWEEYKKAANTILNPTKIPDELNRIAINIAKNNEDFETKISQYLRDFSAVTIIPTKVSEINNENSKYVKATPVKEHDIMTLKTALSAGTLGGELKKIYDDLNKVDASQFDIKDGDSEELIANKTKCARQVWKVKLSYFMTAGKVALNTTKIAFDNLAAIRGSLKGGSAEEVQKNSAIFSAVSDIFCESIIEF